MNDRPPTPPEGELIKAALEKVAISQREAARQADISEARWRQIVSGYQSVGGSKASFRSPDKTLARMAHVVHVTPEDLESAGRAGAAQELRAIQEAEREAEQAAAEARASGAPPVGAVEDRVEERWQLVQAVLRQAGVGLTKAEYSDLARHVNVFFKQESTPAALPEQPSPHRKRRSKS